MAGKTQPPGDATKLQKRARVSRYKLNVALSDESDPRRRVALAMDYLRSALAINPDPYIAEKAVVDLIKTGERLYAVKETTK